jgi:hypothetical protein
MGRPLMLVATVGLRASAAFFSAGSSAIDKPETSSRRSSEEVEVMA